MIAVLLALAAVAAAPAATPGPQGAGHVRLIESPALTLAAGGRDTLRLRLHAGQSGARYPFPISNRIRFSASRRPA